MSNKQMVSVPRELLKRLDLGKNTATAMSALPELRALLAQPAQQHQGEPFAWFDPKTCDFLTADGRSATLSMGHGDRLGRYSVPLYTHPAPAGTAEVERLRAALKFYADREHYHVESGDWDTVSGEPLNILWHAVKPDFIEDGTVARNALSASAEPATPSVIACHVDESCGQSRPSAPVEIDERAGFERENRYIVLKRKHPASLPESLQVRLKPALEEALQALPKLDAVVVESDWPEYEPTWAAIQARAALGGEPPGGTWYTDELGKPRFRPVEDPVESLRRLKVDFNEWVDKSQWIRASAQACEGHMHPADVIKKRYDQLQADLSSRDERIEQLRSGFVFETGPYQVELNEDQWAKVFDVIDSYDMGDDNHFVFLEEHGRGLISEILIELGLARAPDADEVSE